MRTIYKYAVNDVENFLETPCDIQWLSVQAQFGRFTARALVDPASAIRPRRVIRRGTGWEIHPPVGAYIGTVQSEGGLFVWHFFDLDA